MTNPILHKRSAVAAKVPTTGSMSHGELAINYEDGLIFTKKNDGTIITFKSINDIVISDLNDVVAFEASNRTGAADVTVELKTFIESNPNIYIFIPPGIYLINDLDVDTSLLLYALPGTVTFIHDNTSNCISYAGYDHGGFPTLDSVTAITKASYQTNTYVTRLTVADASLYSTGDRVHISSDDDINSIGWAIGEGAKVLDVDTINDYIYLDRILEFHDDYATSIKIQLYDMARKVHISGVSFTSNGNHLDDTINTRNSTVDIRGQQNVIIERCHFFETWAKAIILFGVNGGVIKNCRFENIPDIDLTPSGQTFGSCVQLWGACFGIIFKDSSSDVCRNMVTTFGDRTVVTYNNANWWLYGVPTACTFEGLVCQNPTGNAFETEKEGKGLIFKDCSVEWPTRGSGSQDQGGVGMMIKSLDTTIEGFVQSGGEAGIEFVCTNFARKAFHKASDITIRNLFTNDNTDKAIIIGSQTGISTANLAAINLSSVVIEKVSIGIDIGADSTLNIGSIQMNNFWKFCNKAEGSKIIGDEAILDYSDSEYAGTLYGITITGGVGKTNECIINNAVIIKGNTSARPTEFILANDTTGTKEYFVGELLEYNPSAVARTEVITANTSLILSNKIKKKYVQFEKNQYTGANHTIVSSDWGAILEFTNAATVTLELSRDAPLGTAITVAQMGTGSINFVAGTGATLVNRRTHAFTSGQYALVTLLVVNNTDGQSAEYVLSGDTAAA